MLSSMLCELIACDWCFEKLHLLSEPTCQESTFDSNFTPTDVNSNFCLSDSNMSMTNLLPIFLLHVSGRPYWNQCLIFRVPLLKSLRMFLVSHVMWTIFQYNVIQHEQQCRILTPGKTNWPAKPFKPLSDSHYLRAHQLRSQDDIWAARKIL